jgi:NADH-quinone oxidoreductase subunit I
MAIPEPPHQRQNFLGGFKLTLEHLGRPPVTRQYPEEKRPKQPRQHGRHVLNRYEDGMEKCIGCELCSGVCPADCIYVRGLDNPPDHPVSPGERYGYVYEINFLRCIHCDLCVEACPTEAITESKLMEFSFTNRNDAIYTKEELLVDDDGKPKHLPWEDWREDDDLHTSGWMRATSPSGSAEFEGRVQWSGELGFGVRSAEGGQSPVRDDATTGSKQLRDTLERHLLPSDLPAAKRGPRGAIGRMMEKAERFAPGAGKKHRAQADSDYARSVVAGNSERDESGTGAPTPAVPVSGESGTGAGSSGT